MRKHSLIFIAATLATVANAQTLGHRIVAAARAQVGVTLTYDPDYARIPYPNGDLPLKNGVCTDVVIRALRAGARIDLQRLVHEDMAAHFSNYPHKWGRKSPDPNIDHRRVPNLQVFFARAGWKLPPRSPDLPGDLVTCILPGNHDHIMIVSDRMTSSHQPLVIHNIGWGAKEENSLKAFPVTGHYRVRLAPRS